MTQNDDHKTRFHYDAGDEDRELHRVFPAFKRWKHLYAFILIELAVLIVLFYLFGKAFA
jgi:hypothetical protein